ncbi:hypothetical protein NC653_018110 [Populus alba x Populus x berolinensis]|uniref:Uncharacterized protein n=1 Tax=Populus alba x Populus x berolinensis TaxID=444605 RepID=A0AAD6QRT9_9ROSI|nr:hypothetical protein NC653_018110 [Populus alba x Populus x berolinensis]
MSEADTVGCWRRSCRPPRIRAACCSIFRRSWRAPRSCLARSKRAPSSIPRRRAATPMCSRTSYTTGPSKTRSAS